MNEAELVFSQILNCDRSSLYLNKDLRLDKDDSFFISSVLKKRIHGQPLQYILGKTEFMGWEFKVTKEVFIPRPETEILVEEIVNLVHSTQYTVHNILELGTGSGCIAVSLAKLLRGITITATDISEKALKIAKENARLNNVTNKIKFIQGSLFTDYRLPITDYDIIVSNPPYILTQEIEKLHPEIQYEPRIALDGGIDGLNFYRRITEQAPIYLKESGFLIMEMGAGQKEAITQIVEKNKNFKVINIVKDYNGIERVIVAKRI